MWLLLSIRYQIESFTLKKYNCIECYEIVLNIFWIYKQEMLMEIILLNKIKTPVVSI